MRQEKSTQEIRDEVNKKTSLITKTKRQYKIKNISHQLVTNSLGYETECWICETSVGNIRVKRYK